MKTAQGETENSLRKEDYPWLLVATAIKDVNFAPSQVVRRIFVGLVPKTGRPSAYRLLTAMNKETTSTMMKEDTERENIMASSESSDSSYLPTSQVCQIIQNTLENMTRGMRCPVCLCTFADDSVLLSNCVHSYCRSCLSCSGPKNNKEFRCPTCLERYHPRRSIVPQPLLGQLGKLLHQTKRSFGLAPLHYTPSLATLMTQQVPDEAEEGATTTCLSVAHRHLQVSRTFAAALQQQPQENAAASGTPKIVLDGQNMVVQANEQALLEAVRNKTNTEESSTKENCFPPMNQITVRKEKKKVLNALEPAMKQDTEPATRRTVLQAGDVLGDDIVRPKPAGKHNVEATPLTAKVNLRCCDKKKPPPPPIDTRPLTVTFATMIRREVDEDPAMKYDGDQKLPALDFSPSTKTPKNAPITALQHTPPTASTTASATPESHRGNDDEEDKNNNEEVFPLGSVVMVQPRTWPGINKPGGVGRVTSVTRSSGQVFYMVKYVLGGREKDISSLYVSLTERESQSASSKPSHRRRVSTTDDIPLHILQELAAEGFDTVGMATVCNKQNNNNPGSRKAAKNTTMAKKRPRSSSAVPTTALERSEKKRNSKKQRKVPQYKRVLPKSSNTGQQRSTSKTNTHREAATTCIGSSVSNATLNEDMSLDHQTNRANEWYSSQLKSALTSRVLRVTPTNLNEHDERALNLLSRESKQWESKWRIISISDRPTDYLTYLPCFSFYQSF